MDNDLDIQMHENVKWGTSEPISFMSNDNGELKATFYGKYSYRASNDLTEEDVRKVFVNGLSSYISSLNDINYYNISLSIKKDELLDYVNKNSDNIVFFDLTFTGDLTMDSKAKLNSY